MTPDTVIEIGRQALVVTILISAPLMLAALGTGLIVGIFQAATQIQDMTLSFIPKLIVLVITLGLTGHWMLRMLVDYAGNLIRSIPELIG